MPPSGDPSLLRPDGGSRLSSFRRQRAANNDGCGRLLQHPSPGAVPCPPATPTTPATYLHQCSTNLNFQFRAFQSLVGRASVAREEHQPDRLFACYQTKTPPTEMTVFMSGNKTTEIHGSQDTHCCTHWNTLQSDRDLFFEAGVDYFQKKPLPRDKLLQLLARYGVKNCAGNRKS